MITESSEEDSKITQTCCITFLLQWMNVGSEENILSFQIQRERLTPLVLLPTNAEIQIEKGDSNFLY